MTELSARSWQLRKLASWWLALTLTLSACSNPPERPPASGRSTQDQAAQKRFSSAEVRCLALSMYWEAKAEGRAGLLAVGHVVLNRVAHPRFPNRPCAVVYDGGEQPPCQFSWYCDGKSDRPTEAANWANAQALAIELLAGKLKDNTRGALFFHGKQMKNPWRVPRTRTVTIGNHVFYKL